MKKWNAFSLSLSLSLSVYLSLCLSLTLSISASLSLFVTLSSSSFVFLSQVLQVLDGVEIAPGTQIFTGQDGTTLIPSSFPHSSLNENYSSSVRDSTTIMSHDRGDGREMNSNGDVGNSMDGDVKEDESGGRPEHPSEFYALPVPSSLSPMDVAENN